jgi:hypothetical protein
MYDYNDDDDIVSDIVGASVEYYMEFGRLDVVKGDCTRKIG